MHVRCIINTFESVTLRVQRLGQNKHQESVKNELSQW